MRLRTVLSTVVFAGISLSLLAAGPGKPSPNVPVSSLVLDYAADIAPRLDIQSDGAGTYVNASTLVSQIQSIGDWELDARSPKGATRKIYLDFMQPIPGSAPNGANPTAPPAGMYKFRIIARCSAYGNSLLGFTAGAVKECPLHVGFDYGGGTWAFVMDPLHAANGPFPQTNTATVACIFPTIGTGACSQWKFTPSGTYTAADGTVKYRNVAKLLEGPTTRHPVDHGDFYLSFSMILVK